ncbi:MAG TPA: hypothetical protein PK916_04850 [Bacteroidota bacterium]|nr:hypothetical protein [Bacteroidota bacterium]
MPTKKGTETESIPFSVLVDEVLNAKRLSVTELVTRAGISKGLYYKWKEGVTPLRVTMLRVADALGVEWEFDSKGQPSGWTSTEAGAAPDPDGVSAILSYAAGRLEFSEEHMIQQYEELRRTYGLPHWEDLPEHARNKVKMEYVKFKASVHGAYGRFISSVVSGVLVESEKNEMSEGDD